VWNNHLFSGLSNGTILKWNEKGQIIQTLKGHDDWIACLTIWKNYLCSGSLDQSIRIWNESGECISILNEHTDSMTCMVVWKDFLYSSDRNGSLRKWTEIGEKVSILQIIQILFLSIEICYLIITAVGIQFIHSSHLGG